MNKKLLSHIIANYNSETDGMLSDYIAEAMSRYETIKKNIAQAKANREANCSHYKECIKECERDIIKIMSECDHPITTHYYGYDDSYSSCDICGKEL